MLRYFRDDDRLNSVNDGFRLPRFTPALGVIIPRIGSRVACSIRKRKKHESVFKECALH